MNKILYLVFMLLFTSCSNIEQKNINRKENNESNINTNLALIYTEWFVNQACSLRNLAPGKYIFSKFDVTPNDIIKFQKLEIINLYLKKDDPQRKEKIDTWIEDQRDAAKALNMKDQIKSERSEIHYLINILDEQAKYVNKLYLQMSTLD